MTTSTPNTPQELVNLNTPEPNPLEQVEKYCGELDYSQTLQVVRWLVNNLLNFHKEKVQELTQLGRCEQLTNWVVDQTHLWTVGQLLSKVE